MRQLIVVLLFFFLCACPKSEKAGVKPPASLSGKILRGTVVSATGFFTGLEGYQFTTQFIGKSFETKNAAGVVESAGEYEYRRGNLFLESHSGIHIKKTLKIEFQFSDAQSGTYTVYAPSGSSGEETGLFEIQ